LPQVKLGVTSAFLYLEELCGSDEVCESLVAKQGWTHRNVTLCWDSGSDFSGWKLL